MVWEILHSRLAIAGVLTKSSQITHGEFASLELEIPVFLHAFPGRLINAEKDVFIPPMSHEPQDRLIADSTQLGSENPRRFSETLHAIREKANDTKVASKPEGRQGQNLTLNHLLELAGPKGHVFLIVFLILPFLQPIPLPGLSTLVGLSIAMLGIFMALERPPKLPDRLGKAGIDADIILRISGVLESIMTRLEKILRPRGRALFQMSWFRRVHGVLLVIHAALLSLPLPIPLSNFLPAFVVFLFALGVLEEDLLVLVVGYIAALVNAAFFIALVVLPYFGIKASLANV